MKMGPEKARELFAGASVARLATVSAEGTPHLVPVTFAVRADELYFAIDHKPKNTWNLRRLRNIRDNERVALLVDHYDDDWEQLWWARADGHAEIWQDAARREDPVESLCRKYHQYREQAPQGPVVAVKVVQWTGWSFTG
ncbi:TIGR03668 family PPOX class F420-dependent oxidoreductase [Streptomyces monticola]|uniref:TIGR03668 family PPOX class F420-dependent oxidoreductase n=1 Tax=Streptomyces monticola TaxID=2666263 RepID=A0ABW2JJI2_9ACTN